jgi:hypothetical protein
MLLLNRKIPQYKSQETIMDRIQSMADLIAEDAKRAQKKP